MNMCSIFYPFTIIRSFRLILYLLLTIVVSNCSLSKGNTIPKPDKVLMLLFNSTRDNFCSSFPIFHTKQYTYFVTANHCVDFASKIFIGPFPGELIGIYPDGDYAIVRIPIPLDSYKICPEDHKVGDPVHAFVSIGGSVSFYYLEGKICSFILTDKHVIFESDLEIWYGSSGGGLLCSHNNIIGVIHSMGRNGECGFRTCNATKLDVGFYDILKRAVIEYESGGKK